MLRAICIAAWFSASLMVNAQTVKPRVGLLANTIPMAAPGKPVAGSHPSIALVTEGLRELGWVDGQTVELVWRSAEGNLDRLPQLAEELVRLPVDVLVAYGPGIDAAMASTDRVPIVMGASGIIGRFTREGKVRIDSLARPGGNVTGMTLAIGRDLGGKRLALLKQAVPAATRVAFLSQRIGTFGPETSAAAKALGLSLRSFAFGDGVEGLEPAFGAMVRDRFDAVIVTEHPITNLPATQASIHRLAQQHRLPVMHEVLGAADSGGLMAYGHDINKLYRRVPYFVDRILRGAKPGEIPIEQPADFELRVNLKAAKAIGLALPQSVLIQADRVID